MIVRCNLGCKLNTTTDASLDIRSNEAICNSCGEVIENLSSYAKQAMKINNDVITPNKKAFTYKCKGCKQEMQAIEKNGNIVGVGCSCQELCNFDISEYAKRAISLYSVEDDE